MVFDDFDERLADALEKRARVVSLERRKLLLDAAKMLRSGDYNAETVGSWLERELALEEAVEMARWAAVPDH